MDDLTPDDLRTMLCAAEIARATNRRLYREAASTAADREVSRHYRRMANNDANWHAEQIDRYSRLEAKIHRMLSAKVQEAA